MIQHKKKPPDGNQAHCYTHASPNVRCAKRTGTCQHAQEIPTQTSQMGTPARRHTDQSNTHQHVPRPTQAQQRGKSQPPDSLPLPWILFGTKRKIFQWTNRQI